MKVLSLCSGVGGAELALKQSDIDAEVIGYAEIDKFASSIYERHFPNHTNLGDLTKIKAEELEDFDMLISGIPCQAFSVAGKQKGFADTRGTIFFDVARILKAKKPKYFLIENVKNFLSHDKGNTFQVIASTLLELGYNIRWDILNSKDFGVPQNRERIYIRGILKEYGDLPDISLTAADLLMGTDVNHDVRMQREIINRKIKARVHQVDIKNLQRTLRAAKRQSAYTIKEIADKIGVPATQAEHYFKTGGSFAIPTPTIDTFDKFSQCKISFAFKNSLLFSKTSNVFGRSFIFTVNAISFKLKDVLDITTDEFDKSLIEFEIKDQSKKGYKNTGISPTITANGDVLIQQTEIQSLNSRVPQGMRLFDPKGISCTQAALGGGWGARTGLYKMPKPLKIATATKKGYDEVYPGDGVRLDHPGSATGRGRTQSKGVGTLTCSSNWGAVDYNFRVRRLMPIEVERLQSFPDNWTQYGKDGEEISDSQRYKCMGNAFTVNVIKYILNSFYDKEVSLNGESN